MKAKARADALRCGALYGTVELLDLEMLAQVCAEQRRYTFFFTLQNLNVMGGVASPPNAMAIM